MKKKKKNLKEKNVKNLKNLKKKYLTQYKKFLTELGRVWFFFAPASKNKKNDHFRSFSGLPES